MEPWSRRGVYSDPGGGSFRSSFLAWASRRRWFHSRHLAAISFRPSSRPWSLKSLARTMVHLVNSDAVIRGSVPEPEVGPEGGFLPVGSYAAGSLGKTVFLFLRVLFAYYLVSRKGGVDELP